MFRRRQGDADGDICLEGHASLSRAIKDQQSKGGEMATSADKINVAIVGGGIAGLTAALRLAQNGCKVTVYEKNSTVGGNLGSDHDPQGNFTTSTRICSAIGTIIFGSLSGNWVYRANKTSTRDRHCAFLKAGEFPKLKLLTNNGSPESGLG